MSALPARHYRGKPPYRSRLKNSLIDSEEDLRARAWI
jgi:hypothetical protein